MYRKEVQPDQQSDEDREVIVAVEAETGDTIREVYYKVGVINASGETE